MALSEAIMCMGSSAGKSSKPKCSKIRCMKTRKKRSCAPMNLNQGLNEKSRKTHRSISHKCIQKCTSLNRNGVQVRNGPDKMTRNSKKQIMNLGKLIGGNLRISTPLNGSTGKI